VLKVWGLVLRVWGLELRDLQAQRHSVPRENHASRAECAGRCCEDRVLDGPSVDHHRLEARVARPQRCLPAPRKRGVQRRTLPAAIESVIRLAASSVGHRAGREGSNGLRGE